MFSHGTSSRVCLYQPYNQCRLVLRAWHPPRSRSGHIVSISTGPTRRQLRDNAAARSIVIGGEAACSVSAGRPVVSALRGFGAVETSKKQLSRNFWSRSIFAFATVSANRRHREI